MPSGMTGYRRASGTPRFVPIVLIRPTPDVNHQSDSADAIKFPNCRILPSRDGDTAAIARNLHNVTARKPPSTRLSVEDWLRAGYTPLAEQGVRALKVESLCQQTGVTRGSFYWHFEDMDSYRAALVESWKTFLEPTVNRWPNSMRCHRENGCPP